MNIPTLTILSFHTHTLPASFLQIQQIAYLPWVYETAQGPSVFARLVLFSPFNFCQSLGRGVASHCSDLHLFGCYWSWSSFYTYVVSIARASPVVIGLMLNWGRWKCSRCICALPHPSSTARKWWLQSWLMPFYLSLLGCSPSRVSRGWGVLVSRGVAMVEMGRSSCPVDDHLLLFSSLSDTTQMNNAVPTSPLLQQMGHPHSYPSLGQISNPYEQQPPGKELNKYASLKAVGKHNFFLLSILYYSVPSTFPYL